MKTYIITLIFGCSLLIACKPAVHLVYGVQEARPETPESLLRFLEKHDGPVIGQYIFRDSAAWSEFMGDSVFWHNMIGTMIFDKDLNLIRRDTSKCTWSGSSEIRKIVDGGTLNYYSDFSAKKLLESVRPIWDTASYLLPIKGEYDFLVINTWSAFIGKVSERLFSTGEYAASFRNPRFRVIYLNIDMQKSWNLREDQKLKIVIE